MSDSEVFEASTSETTRLLQSADSSQGHDNEDEMVNSFTVNTAAYAGRGNRLPQYIAAIAVTLGAFAAGTTLGWTSPTQSKISGNETSGDYDFDVSENEFSWIGAFLTLGAALVCIPIGLLADGFGRKITMLCLIVPFSLGWLLIIFATNLATLFVGRFFLGIAGGAFCITAPMYTGEIAEKEIRGTLGSYFQLLLTIGILFVYAVGPYVSVTTLSWICFAFPLIFGIVFFFMPESPYYLVSKRRPDPALTSLKWLRGPRYDSNAELSQIQRDIDEVQSQRTNIGEAFMRPASMRAMGICVALMIFQQFSGVNAVIFYTNDIFSAAGSSLDPAIATIIIGVIQVVATFISSLVVDGLGRKLLLSISDGVMTICLVALGVFFYLQDDGQDVESIGWLPVVSLCVFIVAFSFGFGPVPWLLLGEMFAGDIKGVAAPICATLNWLLAFTITKTFTDLVNAIQRGPTFWLFAAVSLVGTLFCIFVIPETKGKTLQEIQRMLAGDRAVVPPTTVTTTTATTNKTEQK